MDYKKIFVDSDILLDVLLSREPFNKYGQLLLQERGERNYKLYSSTLIFANVFYMVAKKFNRLVAKEQLKILCSMVDMLPFESENVFHALNSIHIDFEDTIQFFIAKKHNCELIISKNIKHYKQFDLPIMTAEQFLQIL